MDIVRQELIAGNRVDISEFGVFQALKQSEYILIDLETGERYLMPPSVEVVFEAAIVASDFQTSEADHALHFIPDTSFEEEANSPFALFEPTLINEGVYFPGMTEVVINEPKEAGEELEVTSVIPETLDTVESLESSGIPNASETLEALETPETSETSETPEAPEVPSIPDLCHQRRPPSIWIPIIGGAVVALVTFLLSRHKEPAD